MFIKTVDFEMKYCLGFRTHLCTTLSLVEFKPSLFISVDLCIVRYILLLFAVFLYNIRGNKCMVKAGQLNPLRNKGTWCRLHWEGPTPLTLIVLGWLSSYCPITTVQMRVELIYIIRVLFLLLPFNHSNERDEHWRVLQGLHQSQECLSGGNESFHLFTTI